MKKANFLSTLNILTATHESFANVYLPGYKSTSMITWYPQHHITKLVKIHYLTIIPVFKSYHYILFSDYFTVILWWFQKTVRHEAGPIWTSFCIDCAGQTTDKAIIITIYCSIIALSRVVRIATKFPLDPCFGRNFNTVTDWFSD